MVLSKRGDFGGIGIRRVSSSLWRPYNSEALGYREYRSAVSDRKYLELSDYEHRDESGDAGLTTAHCYLGGDPHLAAMERPSNTTYQASVSTVLTTLRAVNAFRTPAASATTPAAAQTAVHAVVALLGGDSTTWTDSSIYGHWIKWTGPVDARVPVARPNDSNFLFPIYRGLNAGTKGVIYVNGTTGISGTLRGRVTLYATGTVGILNDMRYATDPSLGLCGDILGVIAGANIMTADNTVNSPQNFPGTSGYVNYGDTPDLFLQGVLMALNTSFGAENYSSGPANANSCQGSPDGRGCLYLTGGIIQNSRGAVGLTIWRGVHQTVQLR